MKTTTLLCNISSSNRLQNTVANAIVPFHMLWLWFEYFFVSWTIPCAVYEFSSSWLVFSHNSVYFISLLCQYYCCYYFINFLFNSFAKIFTVRNKKEYVVWLQLLILAFVKTFFLFYVWLFEYRFFPHIKTSTPPYWSCSVRYILCIRFEQVTRSQCNVHDVCAWVYVCGCVYSQYGDIVCMRICVSMFMLHNWQNEGK